MQEDYLDNNVLETYMSKPHVKSLIIQTRKSFEERSLQLNGPAVIPTMFRNHPERYAFVRERDRKFHSQRNPTNPPPQIPTVFTFPEDIFRNLVVNFNNGIFIKPNVICKLVCLRRKICAEEALEEIVTRTPYYYSSDWEQIKLSPFSDPDSKNWAVPLTSKCINYYQFIADFSIIYPEGKVSSCYLSCYDCGLFVETILNEYTQNVIKKDIWKNICHMKFSRVDGKPTQSTMRMSTRSGLAENLAFTEGHMAVAPLASANPLKPSLFVRSRIVFFTGIRAPFRKCLHHTEAEANIFPSHEESMLKFGIIPRVQPA